MKNIILFGTMGAGKDTVADYLVAEYGYMKEKLGKYIHDNCDKYNYKGIDNRKIMQEYGQMCRQLFGTDIWNEAAWNEIQDDKELYSVFDGRELSFVIADGRQTNEFDYWNNKGFITIGIYADEETRKERLFQRDGIDQSGRFNHDTELQAAECFEKCRYKITNNDSIPALKADIKMIMADIQRCEHD